MKLYKTLYSLLLFPLVVLGEDISQEKALPAPKWVKDGALYCIFVRDFSKEGDFNGVMARFEEIKKLGTNILWFMPIQPNGQKMKKGTIGSPYAIQDYYAVNPAFGTKDDFKKLVAEAHNRGLKVIIDQVVNHTSWDNPLIKEHPEYYKHDAQNRIIPPLPEWKDVAALNYADPALRAYILEMLKYWIKELDLDGYRFDAASFVPLDFWEEARVELTKIKPDLLLLGEEDNPEALVKAFDLDYDWKFEETLSNILMNGAPATATLQNFLAWDREAFPQGALHLRFSDNHDKRRAIARYSEKGALAASALVFTIDGVPLVYNGMEVGDTSESTDPALFEKIPIFWQTAEMRPEFARFYPAMIELRKTSPALRDGEMIWRENSDEDQVVTFLRKNADEEFLIAINFSNRPFAGVVEVEEGALYQDITPAMPKSKAMLPALILKPWEFRVLKRITQRGDSGVGGGSAPLP